MSRQHEADTDDDADDGGGAPESPPYPDEVKEEPRKTARTGSRHHLRNDLPDDLWAAVGKLAHGHVPRVDRRALADHREHVAEGPAACAAWLREFVALLGAKVVELRRLRPPAPAPPAPGRPHRPTPDTRARESFPAPLRFAYVPTPPQIQEYFRTLPRSEPRPDTSTPPWRHMSERYRTAAEAGELWQYAAAAVCLDLSDHPDQTLDERGVTHGLFWDLVHNLRYITLGMTLVEGPAGLGRLVLLYHALDANRTARRTAGGVTNHSFTNAIAFVLHSYIRDERPYIGKVTDDRAPLAHLLFRYLVVRALPQVDHPSKSDTRWHPSTRHSAFFKRREGVPWARDGPVRLSAADLVAMVVAPEMLNPQAISTDLFAPWEDGERDED